MKNIRHGKLIAGDLDSPPVRLKNPLKIQDITLRDGHQSIFATRARTEDFIPIAQEMDQVGFYSMEVWGGATFDTMHRFLAEDPWERIRTLKKYIKKTPFSMLLRGQNLVGYRNYPDDVAEAFVERACENGMDIFRVFDALNDFRNFDTVVRVIKRYGRHFQGSICYSLTYERMGGEVYNLEYYLKKAKELQDMGADTICIKDMAGLIAPYDAYALVKALKETVSVPVHLHSHFTSGMADMSLLKAVEAGVDIVDTCLSPWAYRTSHPAVEPLVATLKYTDRDTSFDLKQLAVCSEYFEKISPRYRHLLDNRTSIIDINVLLHQTPGGMLSNLVNQLREMDALDKLDEVFAQLPVVRRELGQVPLVTPTSQIVGIQTVNNVLFDTPQERYKMITAQVKDLCYGLYGRTPVPLDPDIQKTALADYHRGQTPITVRPADVLEPELEKARNDTRDLARDVEDVITYALYPLTGFRFLKWKYGLEEIPKDMLPKPPEDELAKGLEQKEKQEDVHPLNNTGLHSFNVSVNGNLYRIEIEQTSGERIFSFDQHPKDRSHSPEKDPVSAERQSSGQVSSEANPGRDFSAPRKTTQKADPATGREANVSDSTPIVAPMPGMIIRYEVEKGSIVNEGDVVLILEAMKMENYIVSPVNGVVQDFLFGIGDSVKKNDILALVM
ncbi:MAG: pyruvate carboxylase subunit B [Deltaproteobacteria bacterium]|nr:pyruvate carboxylase subunit B [Deltaproteobacteria bacterium]